MRKKKVTVVPEHFKNGCAVGITNLRYGDVPAVKERLQEVLEVGSRQAVDGYINGTTNITVAKAIAIQSVFGEYGIDDPVMIWGSVSMPKAKIQRSVLQKAEALK